MCIYVVVAPEVVTLILGWVGTGAEFNFLQDHSGTEGLYAGNDELLIWRGFGSGQKIARIG